MRLRHACLMGMALTASAALLASPAASAPAGAQARAPQGSQTFDYTGSVERFTVPEGVCELSVTAHGAQGGMGQYGNEGGKGARVTATLDVLPGQVLSIDVGEAGRDGDDATAPTRGGHGGGGQGGAYRVGGEIRGIAAGGGGGRTVISRGGAPLVVAGGGGGAGGSHFGGDLGGGAGGERGEPGKALDGDDEGKPGRPGGEGGQGGSNVPTTDPNGENGSPAQDPVGGRGGDNTGDPHGGVGGGGGGGATGGGGGAASPTDHNSGAGGGGGSSSGPAGSVFGTGVQEGDGNAVLEWQPCAYGSLTVKKSDKATGKPLAGGVFEVWRETNGIPGLQFSGSNPDTPAGAACSTDQQGVCVFDDLPLDTYYLRETAVPEGYRLPANPVFGPYTLTDQRPDLSTSIRNARGGPCKGKDCK